MKTIGMIEITGVDLAALVRAAYEASRQQGLGYMDVRGRSSELSDEVINEILSRHSGHVAFNIDYLNGRSVKFTVYRNEDRLFIKNRWYDHSDQDLIAVLERVGLPGELVVQRARDEEDSHKSRVKEAALTYLRERGGTVRQNRGLKSIPTEDEKLPEYVEEGLQIARFGGLVTETYDPDGLTTWRLA